jgi:hypothetical protein
MTYSPITQIESFNGPSTDALDRWRTSVPVELFNQVSRYDIGSLQWDTLLVGSGSVTHLPLESTVALSTGGVAANSSCIRQTFSYFMLPPAKSHFIIMSAVIGAKKTNVRQRWGYFDADNGVFFEQDENNLKIVARSNGSDAASISQNNWNVDTLDGNGPSGITLDTSKGNVFWFDFQGVGVGRTRVGILSNDGTYVICHEFRSSNVVSQVYIGTGDLPLRYEITNTGIAASATVLKQITSSVFSEGTVKDYKSHQFAVGRGTTAATASTRRAILSLRPKTTFNGLVNRIQFLAEAFETSVSTNDGYWEIVYNPTFTGTPVWADANSTYSAFEYSTHSDAASGAFTGGIVVDCGYIVAGQGPKRHGVISHAFQLIYPITLDMLGANPKSLSLVMTSLSGSCSALGTFVWSEIHN